MFNRNRKNLLGQDEKTSVSSYKNETNSFLKAGLRNQRKEEVHTLSGNGAEKLTTTDNEFVDQFASASNYKSPRDYDTIATDMQKIWSMNALLALKLVFYLRLITRKPVTINGVKYDTHRGQGLKHEGIMRMLWVAINHPKSFYNNLVLWTYAGSWKDIFEMLRYDILSNTWETRKLNWSKIAQVIQVGLASEQTRDLVKKYLPTIRSRKAYLQSTRMQANTIIGKYLASKLFPETKNNYKLYRKLKSSGEAHVWQQLMSKGQFDKIDFNSIHGRALAQLASSKFLQNHGLEKKYLKWIERQPVAKYTGYPYELVGQYKQNSYSTFSGTKAQEHTINKQFMGLVEKAKQGLDGKPSPFIVVMDTSASMTSPAIGTNVSAYGVAASMALFFSYLLEGPFKNAFYEFSSGAILRRWNGKTPLERLSNMNRSTVAGTDFQAVARDFVNIKRTGVDESEFPTGILCVSDGEFNRSEKESNFDSFLSTLRNGGFSKNFVDNFKVVLWDIPNGYYGNSTPKFEDFADRKGLFHIGGFDPAVVAFLMGSEVKDKAAPTNSEELFEAAMDQRLLDEITV